MSKWDFLSCDKESLDTIANIDKNNFLDMKVGNAGVNRQTLFSLAMAMGSDQPLELENRKPISRDSYLEDSVSTQGLIVALSIGKIEEDVDIEIKLDKTLMCRYAEKCAKNGFRKIDNIINNYPIENRELKLIEELDLLYEKYVLEN